MQQLRIRGHEDELIAVASLRHSDDLVARLERDDLELGLARPRAGRDTFDGSLAGSESDRLAVERDETEHPLLGADRQVFRDLGAGRELDRIRGNARQVDGGETDEAPGTGDGPDLASTRRGHAGPDCIVPAATTGGRERAAVLGQIDSDGTTGGRQQHLARGIRDLQHRRRLAGRRGGGDGCARLGEQGASRCAESLSDLLELLGDELADAGGIGQNALEVGDLGAQFVGFSLQLDPAELGQSAKPQLQDVLGLQLAQVEDIDEPRAGLIAVVALANDLNDLVNIQDRDQQTLDEVKPFTPAREPVLAAATNDREPMVEVDLQQFLQAQSARSAADESDVVDREAVFEGGETVELLEHGIRAEAGLDADHQSHAVLAVGEVGDIGDAIDALGVDAVLDLLDHPLGADEVGKFRDDEPGLAGRDRLDGHLCARLERPASGGIGIPDSLETDDRATGRQVGAGYERHEVFESRVWVVQEVPGRADDLDEIVRCHVRGHADGDAARSVDEEIGERRRQDLGLSQ